jgi:UDPglucose--hexose-1-phosphate uridylyltransferase
MPQLRRDLIVNRWTVIAENRANRPGAVSAAASNHPPNPDDAESASEAIARCPFCPGHEHETPGEVLALRATDSQPNAPGWRVRIVPNKYPAFETQPSAPNDRPLAVEPQHDGPFFASQPAAGIHEVVIDTPRHLTTVSEMTDDELAASLGAIRARLLDLERQRHLKHVLIFKNVGRAAGATRDHLHSQLIGGGFVPPLVAEELAGAAAFYEQYHLCPFCRMIEAECAAGERLIDESPHFVAFCPYASRFPYELWILPRRHGGHFAATSLEEIDDLANFARRAIAKIERLSQPAAYNLVFHTSPFDSPAKDHYHWHIEVFPRMTIAAGFEWGSGCAINPVSPEAAAAFLRNIES